MYLKLLISLKSAQQQKTNLGCSVFGTCCSITWILKRFQTYLENRESWRMTQQVPSRSKLRKGFLIVGIVLLILGFFFFYWASRVNWNYLSAYEESVNVGYPTSVSNIDGSIRSYFIYRVTTIETQSGDYLTVECPPVVLGQEVYIILSEGEAHAIATPALVSEGAYSVTYTSCGMTKVIYVDLGIPSDQNLTGATVSVILNLTHYETPQWILFSFGIITLSGAFVAVFKSRKVSMS
jgi:hypothetical protein